MNIYFGSDLRKMWDLTQKNVCMYEFRNVNWILSLEIVKTPELLYKLRSSVKDLLSVDKLIFKHLKIHYRYGYLNLYQ